MHNRSDALQVSYKGKTYTLSVRQRPATTNNLIVFLHGWGCAKESFVGAFSASVLQDYALCAIDLVGFGQSDRPSDFSYDLLDQAHITALAINSLNAKRVYVVGHSMGGGIGLLAAPLIKNLATFISAEGNLAPQGGGLDARIAASQPFWLFRYLTLPALRCITRLCPDRGTRLWARWSRQASPLSLHKSVQSLARWSDSGELLPRFTSPPHKSYIYSAKGQRKKDVVPTLAKSITYEIPNCGHGLMIDNPHDFYATVATIIQTN